MSTLTTVPVSIIHYSVDSYDEIRQQATLKDCAGYKDADGVTWINVDRIDDTSLIESLSNTFGLHELTIKDIANNTHRVKLEDFGSYILIILKMLTFNDSEKTIDTEQLSIVFGANYLVTFQEAPGDFFNAIRDEIKIRDSSIRKMGSDYLACRIIDIIVDNYFNAIEKFGEEIEYKEEELVANPSPQTLQSIQGIKKEMLKLRQYVWPVREIISEMGKINSSLVNNRTVAYFRDVYDRVFEAMDMIEVTREMVSGLIDIYLSSMSNRTNEVMKWLTIIATIFIPLTFIVGLYGMNFQYMPELSSPYGYPAVLLLMLAIAAGMLFYFHRRKWI